MPEKKNRSLDSFLIAVILHIVFVIILASYLTITQGTPESAVNVAWVELKDTEYIPPRPLLDESLIKNPLMKRAPGVTTIARSDYKSSDLAQVLAPSPEIIRRSVEVNPRGISTKILPIVTTDTKLGPSSEIPLSGPVTTANGSRIGKGAVTGRARAGGQGGKGGISFIDSSTAQDTGATSDSLLEKLKAPTSVPENELGGVLMGRGTDISGHIRLIRVKHALSDWWQDPTALTGLVDWLNKNTRIRADMKVAGGVLTLDDPMILDAPLVIMTGHDRSLTLQRNLMQPDQSGGKLVDSLTDKEKAGLREYLVDRGGMLFFDDCGFNGLFADEFKAIMRQVLPEYNFENIPTTHKIFNCYYNLPGPPRGSEMFWGTENEGKGTVFPYLQGITIGTRLAVVYSRKDYLCAIETVEIPSHTQLRYRYSPEVYKFMTNLVVYAMRYGGITDRSDYNK